jgi:hypothetical protein
LTEPSSFYSFRTGAILVYQFILFGTQYFPFLRLSLAFGGICVLTPTLKCNCSFALMILPFIFHKSLRFYPQSTVKTGANTQRPGAKSQWLVKNKEQNHIVGKMRVKPQLQFKAGVRTQKNLCFF